MDDGASDRVHAELTVRGASQSANGVCNPTEARASSLRFLVTPTDQNSNGLNSLRFRRQKAAYNMDADWSARHHIGRNCCD